jgi:hypothetical protein
MTAALVGNYDPVVAVQEELRNRNYDGVIISTLPPGLSRWLGLDLPAQIARRFPQLRIIHVIAQPTVAPTS